KVLADVIARYHRLKGDSVFFLTGVDQHGQKVQQSAAKAGVPPVEFVKEITQKFIDLWKKLDVKYDDWAETTSDRHKKVVQGILQSLFDAGQIYKDKQAGYYSIRQEQFLTDKERGPDGEFGPEWGQVGFRELRLVRSVNELHQFRWLRYEDRQVRKSTAGISRSLACSANHRQRYSRSCARHLLAHHAACDRIS